MSVIDGGTTRGQARGMRYVVRWCWCLALAACASTRAPPPQTAQSVDVAPVAASANDGIWRPSTPPAALPRFAFRIALSAPDDDPRAYLALDETSHFYDRMSNETAPPHPEWIVGPDFVLRSEEDGHVAFFLRESDGELRGAGDDVWQGSQPPQDLHCHFTLRAELTCSHDDGQVGFTYVVEGDRVVGWVTGHPEPRVPMNTVEPAPTTDEERRLVLFVFALWAVPTDTSSHDGDRTFY